MAITTGDFTTTISGSGLMPTGVLASASQAAVTTTAAVTTGAAGGYCFANSTQAAAVITLVNQLRADLITAGIIKGSA